MPAMLLENLVNAAKWIVNVIGHEDATLKVNNQRLKIILPPQTPAPSGGACRKIRRSNQVFVLVQKRIDLFFLPDMIAGGQYVHAGGKELFGTFDIDAHSAGGIFRVGDCQVNLFTLKQRRDEVAHSTPSRTPDHISENQNPHSDATSHLISRSRPRASRESR